MYPELFNIGPVSIRSYGVMLALSFFLGLYYIYHVSQKKNIDFGLLVLTAYVIIIGSLIGARLSYVLFHIAEFQGNWSAIFNPFHAGRFGIGGLNLYGGIIGAVIGSYIFLKIKGLSVPETFDIYAPTIGLGLFFTRIGCFLNGCCYGSPSHLPWAVTFPENSLPYYTYFSTPLHPAQLYSALYGLLLFFILHHKLNNRRFTGQVVALLFMIEAPFRFAIEYVRHYESAMSFSLFGVTLTYNQLIAIGLFLFGLSIYIVQSRVYKAGLITEAKA